MSLTPAQCASTAVSVRRGKDREPRPPIDCELLIFLPEGVRSSFHRWPSPRLAPSAVVEQIHTALQDLATRRRTLSAERTHSIGERKRPRAPPVNLRWPRPSNTRQDNFPNLVCRGRASMQLRRSRADRPRRFVRATNVWVRLVYGKKLCFSGLMPLGPSRRLALLTLRGRFGMSPFETAAASVAHG